MPYTTLASYMYRTCVYQKGRTGGGGASVHEMGGAAGMPRRTSLASPAPSFFTVGDVRFATKNSFTIIAKLLFLILNLS